MNQTGVGLIQKAFSPPASGDVAYTVATTGPRTEQRAPKVLEKFTEQRLLYGSVKVLHR